MSESFDALISCLIMMLSLCLYGYILFGYKKEAKRKEISNFLILIIGTILHTIIFLYLKGTTKTLLLCVIYVFTLKRLFNISYAKSIFVTILYTILLIIPELIVLNGAVYIFGIEKSYYYTELAGGIICSFCVNVIMLLFIFLIRKPLKKLINYGISTNKKIIFISFLTLATLGIFFYNLIINFKSTNNIISYLVIIATLILILFYLFKQKIDSDKLKNRYDELLEVMKNYESDIEAQRTVFHETKNEIMTIRSKINDKEDAEAITQYIDSILGDKNKNKNSMAKYSMFKYLPSNGLKGFFYYKFSEAEKKNIKVSVRISEKIENSFLGKLNVNDFKQLTRIVGVYLDNAIEASSTSKGKALGIEVYLLNNEVNIIISNTFDGNIDEEKLGQTRFTTKGKNHGHGLLLVKSIINSNSIFESKTNIVKDIFTQTLIITNPNE